VIFKPLSGEATVDVFDITYKAAKMLEPNTPDGKLALAIYSGVVSKGKKPDEVIMFCVDKSGSMAGSAQFTDISRHTGLPKKKGDDMSRVCHCTFATDCLDGRRESGLCVIGHSDTSLPP
jgi:hypothetical protein